MVFDSITDTIIIKMTSRDKVVFRTMVMAISKDKAVLKAITEAILKVRVVTIFKKKIALRDVILIQIEGQRVYDRFTNVKIVDEVSVDGDGISDGKAKVSDDEIRIDGRVSGGGVDGDGVSVDNKSVPKVTVLTQIGKQGHDNLGQVGLFIPTVYHDRYIVGVDVRGLCNYNVDREINLGMIFGSKISTNSAVRGFVYYDQRRIDMQRAAFSSDNMFHGLTFGLEVFYKSLMLRGGYFTPFYAPNVYSSELHHFHTIYSKKHDATSYLLKAQSGFDIEGGVNHRVNSKIKYQLLGGCYKYKEQSCGVRVRANVVRSFNKMDLEAGFKIEYDSANGFRPMLSIALSNRVGHDDYMMDNLLSTVYRDPDIRVFNCEFTDNKTHVPHEHTQVNTRSHLSVSGSGVSGGGVSGGESDGDGGVSGGDESRVSDGRNESRVSGGGSDGGSGSVSGVNGGRNESRVSGGGSDGGSGSVSGVSDGRSGSNGGSGSRVSDGGSGSEVNDNRINASNSKMNESRISESKSGNRMSMSRIRESKSVNRMSVSRIRESKSGNRMSMSRIRESKNDMNRISRAVSRERINDNKVNAKRIKMNEEKMNESNLVIVGVQEKTRPIMSVLNMSAQQKTAQERSASVKSVTVADVVCADVGVKAGREDVMGAGKIDAGSVVMSVGKTGVRGVTVADVVCADVGVKAGREDVMKMRDAGARSVTVADVVCADVGVKAGREDVMSVRSMSGKVDGESVRSMSGKVGGESVRSMSGKVGGESVRGMGEKVGGESVRSSGEKVGGESVRSSGEKVGGESVRSASEKVGGEEVLTPMVCEPLTRTALLRHESSYKDNVNDVMIMRLPKYSQATLSSIRSVISDASDGSNSAKRSVTKDSRIVTCLRARRHLGAGSNDSVRGRVVDEGVGRIKVRENIVARSVLSDETSRCERVEQHREWRTVGTTIEDSSTVQTMQGRQIVDMTQMKSTMTKQRNEEMMVISGGLEPISPTPTVDSIQPGNISPQAIHTAASSPRVVDVSGLRRDVQGVRATVSARSGLRQVVQGAHVAASSSGVVDVSGLRQVVQGAHVAASSSGVVDASGLRRGVQGVRAIVSSPRVVDASGLRRGAQSVISCASTNSDIVIQDRSAVLLGEMSGQLSSNVSVLHIVANSDAVERSESSEARESNAHRREVGRRSSGSSVHRREVGRRSSGSTEFRAPNSDLITRARRVSTTPSSSMVAFADLISHVDTTSNRSTIK